MALHVGVTGVWKIEFMVREILKRVRANYLSPGGLFVLAAEGQGAESSGGALMSQPPLTPPCHGGTFQSASVNPLAESSGYEH